MGLERNVVTAGTGPRPQFGQVVTVRCTGYFTDGRRKFWSTGDPGQGPFEFILGAGHVLRGWDEGVAAMQLGERAELVVTGEHGFGARGCEAWGIGPGAALTFDLQLVQIANA